MIAFLDVQYFDEQCTARAAIVLADQWTDGAARWMNVVDVADVAPYQPGEFFRRELPCLQKALASAPERPSTIVINGYVLLDDAGRPRLGARLCQTLGESTPVIGVAKTRFHDAPGIDVYRNGSSSPLIVTAVGRNELDAAEELLNSCRTNCRSFVLGSRSLNPFLRCCHDPLCHLSSAVLLPNFGGSSCIDDCAAA